MDADRVSGVCAAVVFGNQGGGGGFRGIVQLRSGASVFTLSAPCHCDTEAVSHPVNRK